MASIVIEPLLAHCGAQVIFMILSLLKDLSPPATVTGKVQNILRAIRAMQNMRFLSVSFAQTSFLLASIVATAARLCSLARSFFRS